MKKILLLIMCFMFVGVVNARTLSIEEVIDGFLNSTLIKYSIENSADTEKINAVNNTENSSIDIYVGDTLKRQYSYAPGYINFADDREINTETVGEQEYDFIFLTGLLESVITKSGYDLDRLEEQNESFVFNFETYGVDIQTERYSLEEESGITEGDFVRVFKLGFETEKIDALVQAIGLKPDMSDKVPTLTITDKGKNSVSLNAFVTDQDGDEAYLCEIYRSTSKNGTYTKLDFQLNCSTKDVSLVDDNLKKDTTYYYKAKVVGGTRYSNIVSYTNGKIVNPDTGVNNFVPLLIGFVLAIGALVLFRRNSIMKL